ncbi:MAG: PaaI family thioesterase [Myxococcales bacterium]|nr:PaaI family thioesterase [Myxococcales bacterium]
MTQLAALPLTSTPRRERTFAWEDPRAAARAGAALSGIEYLRAIATGALPQPPIGMALGMRLTQVSEGRAVFECTPDETHFNLIGTVHGGLAATLIDSATGCAIYSTLGLGDRWTTVNLSVDYLAGLDEHSGPIRCEANVVRVGGTIAIADARVLDGRGALVARGSTTCLVRRAR